MLDRSARALSLAVAAAARVGLDPREARVIRSCSADIVELPHAGAIARVEPPGFVASARNQARVAQALEQRDAPTMRLVHPEAVVFGDDAVTLWVLLRELRPPTPEALGVTIRTLHDRTRQSTALELPVLDILSPTRRWLAAVELDGVGQLRARLDELEAQLERAGQEDPLGQVLVHGDAHLGNLMITERGPVLIDLERAGVGPASWDLVVLAVWVRRYGFPVGACQRFFAGYGATPRGPVFEAMCSLYEIHAVAWAFAFASSEPRLAVEARIRLDGVLGRSSVPWSLS